MARPKLPVRHTEAASPSTRRFIVVPWKKLRWVNSPCAPLTGSLHSRCLYNSLERYRSIYIAMNHVVNWATRNDKNHKPASSERKKALHTPHAHTHRHTKKENVLWKTTTWQKHMLQMKTAWAAPTQGSNRAQRFAAYSEPCTSSELKCYPVSRQKSILRGWGNGMLAARLLFTTYWGHNAREHARLHQTLKRCKPAIDFVLEKKKKEKKRKGMRWSIEPVKAVSRD